MVKEIVIDENYRTVSLFDNMKKGDIYKVPYDKSRSNGIRTEASRRNREARLRGELKFNMDLKFRTSEFENPGFTTIFRLK